MIKTCETKLHHGKPIPINTVDRMPSLATPMPSKREALAAYSQIEEVLDDTRFNDPRLTTALEIIERFILLR